MQFLTTVYMNKDDHFSGYKLETSRKLNKIANE